MSKICQYLGYSILIIGLISASLYLSASQSEDPYRFLIVWFWFLVSACLGGIAGIIILILRLAGRLRNKASFFYVFSAVLNILLGILAVFYLYGSYMQSILFGFCLGLLLGFAQIIDILSENISFTRQQNEERRIKDA